MDLLSATDHHYTTILSCSLYKPVFTAQYCVYSSILVVFTLTIYCVFTAEDNTEGAGCCSWLSLLMCFQFNIDCVFNSVLIVFTAQYWLCLHLNINCVYS